jgi:hypothetical protein
VHKQQTWPAAGHLDLQGRAKRGITAGSRETYTHWRIPEGPMTLPRAATPPATLLPARGHGRVLAVLDRPVLCEIVKMTLNHCVYSTRTATMASEVGIALA